MEFLVHRINGKEIAEIREAACMIKAPQDILDVMAAAPSNIIVLRKENLDESFFDLRSGLAGGILQKASNYSVRLGIVGAFSGYASRSLQDFMHECNKGNQIVFADAVREDLRRFGRRAPGAG